MTTTKLKPITKAQNRSDVAPKGAGRAAIPPPPKMPRIRRKREEILKSFSSPLQEAGYAVELILSYQDRIDKVISGLSPEAKAIVSKLQDG